MLNAAVPLLVPKYQVFLDRFIPDVAATLANYWSSTPPDQAELPGVQKAVAEVLGACFVRSATRRVYTPQRLRGIADEIEDSYARYLLHQAVQSSADPGKLQVLLETLERSLMHYQAVANGFLLGVPLVAAWIVLRVKSRISNPVKQPFVWPPKGDILGYLEGSLGERGESAGGYAEGIDLLIKSPVKRPLPNTLKELDKQLWEYTTLGDEDGIIETFLRFRDALGTEYSGKAGIFDPKPRVRCEVLSNLIHYLTAPKFELHRARHPERFERCTQEALQLVPRPIPLDIHHSLVASRARAFNSESELESGADVVSLDITDRERIRDLDSTTTKREQALENLHQTWQAAGKEGITKDVKLYMLYMEGLGRLYDVAGLQQTWNELVDDQACKQAYLEQNRARKSVCGTELNFSHHELPAN